MNYCEKSSAPLSLMRRQFLISVPNKQLSLFLKRTNCSFLYLGLDDKPVCIVITNQNKSRSESRTGVEVCLCVMCERLCTYSHMLLSLLMLHDVNDENDTFVCVCMCVPVEARSR